MESPLADLEIRVLGCLIEKSATTPDAYPLTLNGLTTACNQKTARDPVMNLTDNTVDSTTQSLKQRGLVSTRSGAGNSRVTKFSHRMGEQDQLFQNGFKDDELAVLCVLFLRGPQTLNEIKARTNRIYAFGDVDDVSSTIDRLRNRSDGAKVTLLERAPGQKEARYTHLFGGQADGTSEADDSPAAEASTAATTAAPATPAPATAGASTTSSDVDRIKALEDQVAALTKTVNELKAALGET